VNRSAFIDWLGACERAYSTADWRVGGVRIWPLVRLELYANNFGAIIGDVSLSGSKLAQLRTVVRTHVAWAAALARDWSAEQRRVQPADTVFLAYSAGAQPFINGRRYNPLLAPYADIIAAAGGRTLVWEMAPYGSYNTPRHTPSHMIQPFLLRRRMASVIRPRSPAADLAGFDEFVRDARAAGIRSRYFERDTLGRDAGFVLSLAGDFERWLVSSGARTAINADYGPRDLAFILACQRAGVTSIELQHGMQGDSHPAYARWVNVPAGGYELRPRIHWCWDDASALTINAWASTVSGGPRAIVGGDAWRHMWLEGSDRIVREYDDSVGALKATLPARHHLLITLDSLGDPLPQPLFDGVRALGPDWAVWLRLHPANQHIMRPRAEQKLAALGMAAPSVERVSNLPLHALLRSLDVHVTVAWSSVIVEAASFGVRSVASTSEAAEMFAGAVDSGDLVIATDAAAVTAAVRRQADARRAPTPSTVDPAKTLRSVLASPDR
jgi:hypothetical protein